jgi:hypothetical protein
LQVKQVYLDVEAVEEVVKKGLNELNIIMEELKNLPILNDTDLKSLGPYLNIK